MDSGEKNKSLIFCGKELKNLKSEKEVESERFEKRGVKCMTSKKKKVKSIKSEKHY